MILVTILAGLAAIAPAQVSIALEPPAGYVPSADAAVKAYLGNLHSHTKYSDGLGLPSDAYAYARTKAGLDFLAITEHNHSMAAGSDGITIAKSPALYSSSDPASLTSAAKKATVAGKFVALYGQEYSTNNNGNQVNVFDAPKVIAVPNGDYPGLVAWLENNPDSTGASPIVQFNHPRGLPEFGSDKFGNEAAWIAKMDAATSLINLINGPGNKDGTGLDSAKPSELRYKSYLGLGFHVAPTADQDNHFQNWGAATNARTGVLASSLTKQAILQGLRLGRAYASEDKNLRVLAWIQQRLAGGSTTIPAPGAELKIAVRLMDADEPAARYDIGIYTGKIGGPLAKAIGNASAAGNTPDGKVFAVKGLSYEPGTDYMYLVVTQRDATDPDRVWLAPVWFK